MFDVREGEHLADVEAPIRIEHPLHPALQRQLLGRELIVHQVALLDADAVLARQAALDVDARNGPGGYGP